VGSSSGLVARLFPLHSGPKSRFDRYQWNSTSPEFAEWFVGCTCCSIEQTKEYGFPKWNLLEVVPEREEEQNLQVEFVDILPVGLQLAIEVDPEILPEVGPAGSLVLGLDSPEIVVDLEILPEVDPVENFVLGVVPEVHRVDPDILPDRVVLVGIRFVVVQDTLDWVVLEWVVQDDRILGWAVLVVVLALEDILGLVCWYSSN